MLIAWHVHHDVSSEHPPWISLSLLSHVGLSLSNLILVTFLVTILLEEPLWLSAASAATT